jgi:predicted amidohydrolase YtcJ
VGRLIPGFQGDLALLDRDLLSVPTPWIDSTRVVLTVVGGRIVYRAP